MEDLGKQTNINKENDMETLFIGSKDITDVGIARAYLRSRSKDAVQCWQGMPAVDRSQLNIITFAQYLIRYW